MRLFQRRKKTAKNTFTPPFTTEQVIFIDRCIADALKTGEFAAHNPGCTFQSPLPETVKTFADIIRNTKGIS